MIPPPSVMTRLSGDGVTTKWLQERLGISRQSAIDMMLEIGARQSTAHWRLPNQRRRILGAEKWSKPSEYVEPTRSRSIGRTTNRAGAIE